MTWRRSRRGRTQLTGDEERASEHDCLTPRQQAVVALIAAGLSNKEIAAELNISCPTVKNHVTASFIASGARSRVELALWWATEQARADEWATALARARVEARAEEAAQRRAAVEVIAKRIYSLAPFFARGGRHVRAHEAVGIVYATLLGHEPVRSGDAPPLR